MRIILTPLCPHRFDSA